ncbi:MAG: hypothetical protein ACREOC_10765 [Gemmatimonadales bacterium]
MSRIHRRLRLLLILASAGALGCTHHVTPKVTPSKIAAVDPPIASRALLLISPAFEEYTSEYSSGVHRWRQHLGQSVTAALIDLVGHSFARSETRRVQDVELLQWLSAPADTTVADVLLVPAFEVGGMRERAFDAVAETRFRLDVRAYHTGKTYSWPVAGRSARAFSSMRGLTGTALEQALRGLSDTLAAHRGDLEPPTATASWR